MTSDVTAILVALAALLTGSAAMWQQQRGTKTDSTTAAAQLTSIASSLVRDLRDEIDRLRESVADLQHLVAALESEIVTLGGDPRRIRLEVATRARLTDVTGEPI